MLQATIGSYFGHANSLIRREVSADSGGASVRAIGGMGIAVVLSVSAGKEE